MTETPVFKPATRKAVRARIALAGPSGSGKTYTALSIATGLANGDKIAVLDTEKGSASLYADEFTFDVLELGPPFSPERYVLAVKAAQEAGYGVIVVDSLSHAWADEGGILDFVDKQQVRGGNKFAAWQKATPEQNKLVNSLVRAEAHVIVTMRSKQAYAMTEDERGRAQVKKLGLAPIQREGVEFEFSVFGELDLDHTLSISKSRYRALQDLVVKKPGADFARQVLGEVTTGEPSEDFAMAGDGPSEGSSTSGPVEASVRPRGETVDAEGKAGPEDTSGGGDAGTPSPESPQNGPVTEDQLKALRKKFGPVAAVKKAVDAHGVSVLKELTSEQAEELLK